MRKLIRSRTMSAALVVVLLALSVWAAPMLPSNRTLTPDIYSLTDVKKLRIDIQPYPAAMRDFTTPLEALRSIWVEELTAAGYEVVEDDSEDAEKTPKLVLQFMTAVDEKFPGAMGFCAAMTFHQPVHLERIDYHMEARTFHSFAMGLETKEDMDKNLKSNAGDLVKYFIAMQRMTREEGEPGS